MLGCLIAGIAAWSAYAQQIWVGGGRGYPPRWPKASDFDGSWIYCRGYFTPVRREPSGSGWNTDYPDADHNFSVRLAELTRTRVRFDEGREPHFVVMPMTEPLLYHCPMIFMEDFGTARFTEDEVERLREYLLKGGFVWVDDSWGSYAWTMIVGELSRVLPPGEFPMIDIPPDHPIMHTLYDVREIPQVPSISHWSRYGRRDVRARPGQRRRLLQGHPGRARPAARAHQPQHRHRRHLGARGREPAVLRSLLAARLRDRRQRRVVRDDPLTGNMKFKISDLQI